MNITVTDAKAQLTDLVRRAEAGEEIVMTRFGEPVARIEPIRRQMSPAEKKAVIDRVIAQFPEKPTPGPDAAHCSDFLFDEETGLPA